MALLTYTLLRIALVVAAGTVLYLLGVRSWLLVVLAVLMGAALSYVLLDTQRRAAAGHLERRMGGRPTSLERSVDRYAEEEDAELDVADEAGAGAAEPAAGPGAAGTGGTDGLRSGHPGEGTAGPTAESEQSHIGASPEDDDPASWRTGR